MSIALGARTATGDREGDVVEEAPVPPLDECSVSRIAAGFRGEQQQVPPMYSALKHQGERLYRLARKGVEVDRAPRRVVIHRLDLLGLQPRRLELEVACSKGTYVRTLAEDLARACGTVGHVASLRRLTLGPFLAPRMHGLDAIEQAAERPQELDALLLPLEAALPGLPQVQLGIAEQALVLQGRPVVAAGPAAARVRMVGPGGVFLGVGRMSAEGVRLAPERIMVRLLNPQTERA